VRALHDKGDLQHLTDGLAENGEATHDSQNIFGAKDGAKVDDGILSPASTTSMHSATLSPHGLSGNLLDKFTAGLATPTSQIPHDSPPKIRTSIWSAERSIDLCSKEEGELLGGKDSMPHLIKASTSVESAVAALNRGALDCSEGFCVVYSKAREKYVLIYAQGKREKALNRFNLRGLPQSKLILNSVGANNLRPIQNGSCDPFLVARINSEVHHTNVCYHSVNPVWRSELAFQVDTYQEGTCLLNLEVLHAGGTDVSIGSATVDISSFEPDVTNHLKVKLEDGDGAKLFMSGRLATTVESIATSLPAAKAQVPSKTLQNGIADGHFALDLHGRMQDPLKDSLRSDLSLQSSATHVIGAISPNHRAQDGLNNTVGDWYNDHERARDPIVNSLGKWFADGKPFPDGTTPDTKLHAIDTTQRLTPECDRRL
jgi:hypothetical protein